MRRQRMVSIHAPARGATGTGGATGMSWTVSIHAPARGATRTNRGKPKTVCFNPRARAGRDRRDTVFGQKVQVSIHAPARGATQVKSPTNLSIRFNPRARAGRDADPNIRGVCSKGLNPRARAGRDRELLEIAGKVEFQSTRPRGARPDGRLQHGRISRFNPRARAGRDECGWSVEDVKAVSIHAPARGAT